MASIRQRGENSWQVTVSLGYDSSGKKLSKQKSITRQTGFTDLQWKRELESLASEFETSVKRGLYFEPAKYDLQSFIEKWLQERGDSFESKTRYRYEGMLNGRITQAMGHLKLEQIKPLHLLDFYRNLQEVGIREDMTYIANPELKAFFESNEIDTKEFALIAKIAERTLKGILNGKPTNKGSTIIDSINSTYSTRIKLDKFFSPAHDPKPLSNKTIVHHHRLLSSMFNDAVRWGMMQENPCLKVQPPKVVQKEMSCLDEEGIDQMLTCLDKENIKTQTMITMSLITGYRRGEAIALQWPDIDLDNGIVTIKRSASYTPDTGIKIKVPKTSASFRKISIGESTVLLLRQYRKWWLEEKIKVGELWQKDEIMNLGKAWVDPEWVFSAWDGHIMHPDTATKTFTRFKTKYDLQNIRLHDLRHTSATILINQGLNVRSIASRLGHANPTTTLKVYSHALQSTDRLAADILEVAINKKKNTSNTTKQA